MATQTFTGLALVSLAAYLLTAASLERRQDDTLAQNLAQVRHLLAAHPDLDPPASTIDRDGALSPPRALSRPPARSPSPTTPPPARVQQLADFLDIHQELRLRLTDAAGKVLVDHPIPAQASLAGRAFRPAAWRALDVDPAATGLSGTLWLDVRRDASFLQRLGLTLMTASLIGALLVSVGCVLLVRLALSPMRLLVDQTRQLAAEKLHERLDGSQQPEELMPLVDQFNALLERLGRSYAQLEGFNADVAHELRTPLATLITGTEIAMRQPGVPAATLDQLGSNLEELRRMAGIVNDMLFLSHADSGASARRQAVGSLAALAADVADYHEAAIAEAGLRLRIDGDASGEFDAPLLKRGLSNLLGNATRYATADTELRVCIESDAAGVVRLSVSNLGPCIHADHLPRLFDRFYRADPARSRGADHHGLGLSIVAAIARMHGGEPFAQSAEGENRIGIAIAGGTKAPARSRLRMHLRPRPRLKKLRRRWLLAARR
ncbi:heavy metal sensor histidine kinase [Roseateles amylovorans]|uniref:Sensor protein n=1 Tax=Roseateles amylovorans TaxID=2978473 RepID=A0ABY6BBL3_9BURK|nr:heavy metal sensor histidine kinase [Roseateles amylovorans]UXH80587.1 heavy metal sensor histidine kinase [Roseateles amylovorans]